jgi:BirA family biotin operon repressor/biotin-[acetyl-CoA-carboxylase] ligase
VLGAVAQLERDPAGLRSRWEERSCTLGRHVRAQVQGGPIEGLAVRVDALGRLVVKTPGGEEAAVAAGDVTLAEG